MIAASSLSSPSSSSSSSSSQLFRDRVFRRSYSLPPPRPARPTLAPRFSASCAAAAEREREGTTDYSQYFGSYSGGRGGMGALAAGRTLYDVLGLRAGATPQEIKAAYRRLARACHPDVAAAGRKGASADEFMRVHAAYSTLSDPGKRAEYDRGRVMAAAASTTRTREPYSSWTSPAAASHSFSTYYHYSPPFPASTNPSSPSSSFGRRSWETDQCW